MKRWGYFVLAVLAVAWLSGKETSGTDVAKLQPVEVVCVTGGKDAVQITTDTGNRGMGMDVQSAVENLKSCTPSEVFLDTAEYLLITEECIELLPQMMDYLRPSCSVCRIVEEPDLTVVAQYLQIHRPDTTLLKYRAGRTELPTLRITEGRMELVS